jgi:hypothetical protein
MGTAWIQRLVRCCRIVKLLTRRIERSVNTIHLSCHDE